MRSPKRVMYVRPGNIFKYPPVNEKSYAMIHKDFTDTLILTMEKMIQYPQDARIRAMALEAIRRYKEETSDDVSK